MTYTFNLPNTPTVRVEYLRPGGNVLQSCVITNPGSREGIATVMRDTRQLGPSDIKGVFGIKPTTPVQTNYAQHKAAQYARAMER